MLVVERDDDKKDERPIADDMAIRPPKSDEVAMKSELFQAAPPRANVEISADKWEAKPLKKSLPESLDFEDFMELVLTRLPPSRMTAIGDAYDAAVPPGGTLRKREALVLAMNLWVTLEVSPRKCDAEEINETKEYDVAVDKVAMPQEIATSTTWRLAAPTSKKKKKTELWHCSGGRGVEVQAASLSSEPCARSF